MVNRTIVTPVGKVSINCRGAKELRGGDASTPWSEKALSADQESVGRAHGVVDEGGHLRARKDRLAQVCGELAQVLFLLWESLEKGGDAFG